MKRIAVIGDSHTAMIKLAWDKLENDYKSVELIFFVWRSDGVKELLLRGIEDLPVKRIKVLERQNHIVELKDFDVILVCGLGFELRSLMSLYDSYSVCGQPKKGNLISEELYRISAREILAKSTAGILIDSLSKVTDKKIFLLPVPMVAEFYLEKDNGKNLFDSCVENGDEKFLAEVFYSTNAIFSKNRVEVINQPIGTIVNSIFTNGKYSNATDFRMSKRYMEKKGRQDLIHMNSNYGLLIIKEFLTMI